MVKNLRSKNQYYILNLIYLILFENLVIEEKNTFKKSEPKGYKEYERVHNADKKKMIII